MNYNDIRFIALFIAFLLIGLIFFLYDKFDKKRKKKEFMECLKKENFDLYQKFKNEIPLNIDDKFKLMTIKMICPKSIKDL